MAGYGRYAQHGSNAMILNEAYYEHKAQRQTPRQDTPGAQVRTRKPITKQDVQTSRKQAVKPRTRKAGVFSTLFVAVLCFAAFAFIIARYAVICSTGNDITELKNQIAAMKEEANQYSLQISEKMDMAHIQDVASEKLKMGFPKEDQIVYMDLDDDTVDTVAQNGENEFSNGDDKNINVLSEAINVLK